MSAYRLELRPLYCERERNQEWTPLAGGAFHDRDSWRDYLGEAARAADLDTLVRVATVDAGGDDPLPPVLVATRTRLPEKKEPEVVVAEGDGAPWKEGVWAADVLDDVSEGFPRLALSALCDVIDAAQPSLHPSRWIERGLQGLRAWARSPSGEAQAEVARVVDALFYRGRAEAQPNLDPDLARAFAVAAYLAVHHGVDLGPHVGRRMDGRWSPRGIVRGALDFAREATWPGVEGSRRARERGEPGANGGFWLRLDHLLLREPGAIDSHCYRGVTTDYPPPRLRREPDFNNRIVRDAFAWIARRAVPVEVATLAAAAFGRPAPKPQRVAPEWRWQGHRVDFALVDDTDGAGHEFTPTPLRRP